MSNITTAKKAHLPVSRINTIMKSSSDVVTVTKDSSLLMCKAAELFIRQLSVEGYKRTNQAKKLNYKHLAEVVHSEERYNFLRDIMPKKITVAEFKRIMEMKRNMEDDEKKTDESSSSCSEDEDSSSGSEDSELGSVASA